MREDPKRASDEESESRNGQVQTLKPNRSASSVATYISTGHGNRRIPRAPATVRPARYAIT